MAKGNLPSKLFLMSLIFWENIIGYSVFFTFSAFGELVQHSRVIRGYLIRESKSTGENLVIRTVTDEKITDNSMMLQKVNINFSALFRSR